MSAFAIEARNEKTPQVYMTAAFISAPGWTRTSDLMHVKHAL